MKISLDKQLEKRSQEEKKKYDVSHFNETTKKKILVYSKNYSYI